MVRWRKLWNDDVDDLAETARDRSIFGQVWPDIGATHEFVEYDLGSAQQAHTHVDWNGVREEYATTEQMHSEMVAVDEMLDGGHWRLTDDGSVVGVGDEEITVDDFRTDVPHCGFCTVMLHLLGLPIDQGRATKANYNLAEHLGYRLPEEIEDSPVVLGRLLEGHAPPGHRDECLVGIKERLDSFIWKPKPDHWALQVGDRYVTETEVRANDGGLEALDWEMVSEHRISVEYTEYGTLSVGRFLWKTGFDGLYRAQQ